MPTDDRAIEDVRDAVMQARTAGAAKLGALMLAHRLLEGLMDAVGVYPRSQALRQVFGAAGTARLGSPAAI